MTIRLSETFSWETGRLLLRPLDVGDEALFRALYTDVETMRFIAAPLSDGEAARMFHRILAAMATQPPTCKYLVMLDRASRQAIGLCGLPRFDFSAARQEVGLVLTTSARSRGFAREGLTALVDRIFRALPADEVWARFSEENVAAHRLVVAAGFNACEGRSQEQEFPSWRHWSIHRSSRRGVEPGQ